MTKNTQRRQSARVNLRERIQNNIAFIVISGSVAVAGATLGVARYIFDQEKSVLLVKHETEIGALKNDHERRIADLSVRRNAEVEALQKQILSIERHLGTNEFYDIQHFFVDDARNLELSDNAKFYAEAAFYAPLDEHRWEYRKM